MLAGVLTDIGNSLVERVKNQLKADDKIVSGKTANSVRFRLTKNGLEVLANASILTLTKRGRSPSRNKGELPLRIIIREWAKARGIDEKFADAITYSIHKKGIKVPNRYTDGDLLVRAFEGVEKEIQDKLKDFLIDNLRFEKTT